MVLTARETVEFFHLLFTRAFFAGLPDRTLVSIKGGINLRFFFQSPRFSEDLDLDVSTMAKATLENRVDRLLQSPLLLSPLKARGISIKEISKPKQTETAQKWKLGLASADADVQLRTKIEFCRRDDVSRDAFDELDHGSRSFRGEYDKVDSGIASKYSIPPFAATHYTALDAVPQKIHALMD